MMVRDIYIFIYSFPLMEKNTPVTPVGGSARWLMGAQAQRSSAD